MQTHCHLHTFRLYPVDIGGGRTAEECAEVAAAISAWDGADADAAMSQHIFSSFDRFAQAYTGDGALAALERSSRPPMRAARQGGLTPPHSF
jgi:DNA-binding GntR family transcriptional regulator